MRKNEWTFGMSEATRILNAVQQGDSKAAEELIPLVYEELRKLASHKMANEAPGQTLQPTALVHEAWLRVVKDGNPKFEGRGHFFAAAAEAMRRILVERARRKARRRHGGGQERLAIDGVDIIATSVEEDQLLAVHEALEKLAATHERKANLVKLRYFVGLSVEEA